MGACASEGPFARPSVELRGKGGNTLSWSLPHRTNRKETHMKGMRETIKIVATRPTIHTHITPQSTNDLARSLATPTRAITRAGGKEKEWRP